MMNKISKIAHLPTVFVYILLIPKRNNTIRFDSFLRNLMQINKITFQIRQELQTVDYFKQKIPDPSHCDYSCTSKLPTQPKCPPITADPISLTTRSTSVTA